MKKKANAIAQSTITLLIFVWVMLLLNSCSTSRPNNYQNHLRSTHHDNWVKRDNGGCGWSN